MVLLKEIKGRESVLVFDRRDIEDEKIKELMEAARWAPSCFNNQPWRYVFVHRDDPARNELESALSRGNSWAKRVPYLVAVGARPKDDCDSHNLPYYAYDCGLSVMSLTIQAEHMGLRVHQMAGFNEDTVKQALDFPEDYRVLVIFAVGYEGEETSLSDRIVKSIKDRLASPRSRKESSENFFFGRFR